MCRLIPVSNCARLERITFAKVGVLSPDEARERCKSILGNVAHGREPLYSIDGTERVTLGSFIESTYRPWLLGNRSRSAAQSLQRLETLFGKWHATPLEHLTVKDFEMWKLDRINQGRKPSTIARDLATNSGVLSRAVKVDKLQFNVIRKVDVPKLDRTPKVRYLSIEEASRLRTALRVRDQNMRAQRRSANKWRQLRRKTLLPNFGEFVDHLEPAILLSLNTGIRRGELVELNWGAVDMVNDVLTIEGTGSKTKQTRHVPLNAEALNVLERWKKQMSGERLFPFASLKTAWNALLVDAGIKAFRWHDIRHDFASRLASKGLPLNTIRELLGHQSLTMTLRYAHLQPDQKAAAVAKLIDVSSLGPRADADMPAARSSSSPKASMRAGESHATPARRRDHSDKSNTLVTP